MRQHPSHQSHQWHQWHQWLKYSVYGLLALNILLFFREEWQAVAHTFDGLPPPSEVISAFAASIDTTAWVLLLLLFEIETYQLGPKRMTPRLAAAFRVVRGGCYGFIVYAFYGYLSKAIGLYDFVPLQDHACDLADQGYALLIRLDEYLPFDAGMCAALANTHASVLPDTRILAAPDVLESTRRLAWVDVINSSTWIIVVALLEFDVWLQERGRLAGLIESFSKLAKTMLYSILLSAAIYWGVAGPLLDFWDAFLWLFAFVFIELNVFAIAQTSEAAP